MLGVNLVLKKALSVPRARNGDTRLEIKCMRKRALWSIFSGVNRHSSCGDRVTRVKIGHPSCLCPLGQEATFEEENDNHVESIYLCIAATFTEITKENPESGHNPSISACNAVLHSSMICPI